MTTDSNTSTNGKGKAPSHHVYHVREGREGEQGFWTKIGAAWPHKDGKGFNVQVEMVPLDGRLTLRIPEKKD